MKTDLGTQVRPSEALKERVQEFWNARSCGEVYAEGDTHRARLQAEFDARYALEPYIPTFARFEDARGKDVLEVGVGMGADHLRWALADPHSLTGVDLTPRAVEFTRTRLGLADRVSDLRVADAEQLPFSDNSFDLVYSWGVLHHSPNTARAIGEVLRVLRPGGTARIMIYHKYSMTGFMLWGRYALLRGVPGRSLDEIYAQHLESPGTKAFSITEARRLFAGFRKAEFRTMLNFGDLLQGAAGQRHQGPMLATARALWPRWAIKRLFPRFGLMLMVEATR
ncbi:MAG TPA: class I SAM-dependent methyltransferase [Acidobacteriaceae bacterium]|nr:class I SAM-dependent methyltransferase [Acidobacteriaceae bacterium]